MSRTDDIINVAGHRLSTGHIEEVIAAHPQVAECCVFPMNDEVKGQLPVGAIVLKDTASTIPHNQVAQELIDLVRDLLGPVYSFKRKIIVKRLPKTRSGKILRGTLAKIANGEEYKMPATIDDPAVLDDIKQELSVQLAIKHKLWGTK